MEQIKRVRLAHGLSKQQACARAGVSPGTYARAERGEPVSELSAFKIARALGLDAESLETTTPQTTPSKV